LWSGGGDVCVFSTAIHNIHSRGHGQRFGAIGVAFLRGKRLNSLQDLNAHAWAKDGMRLLGAKRASFGQKIPKLCALQVIDLIWGTRLIV